MENAFLAICSILVVCRLIVSLIYVTHIALSCEQLKTSAYVLHVWRAMDISHWLLIAISGNAAPIISEIADFMSCWESVFINLLITGGLFEVCLLGVIIPAHAACQCLFPEVISVLFFNWTAFSFILFGIHVAGVSAIASCCHRNYLPKRNRGFLPLKRSAIKVGRSMQ
jgi:hypothetical protein